MLEKKKSIYLSDFQALQQIWDTLISAGNSGAALPRPR